MPLAHPAVIVTLRAMTTLHLVRHGRATAREADYDQLHAQGVEQSERLGRWLGARAARYDALYVGPLKRQRETLRLMREAAGEAGTAWPEETVLEGLAEAPHDVVLKQHLMPRLPDDAALAAKLAAVQAATDRPARQRAMNLVFDHMIDVWRAGEISGIETSEAFEVRVEEALQAILAREGHGRDVMVVTSNGVIGSILQRHLAVEADPEESLLRFANTSITRISREGEGLRLLAKGEVEHLAGDPDLITIL